MTETKTTAKTHKLRLLRNWFEAENKKRMAGEVVEIADKDLAQRMLKSNIAEKADARSID